MLAARFMILSATEWTVLDKHKRTSSGLSKYLDKVHGKNNG